MKGQLEDSTVENEHELQTQELQARVEVLEHQLQSSKEELIINESKWVEQLNLAKTQIKSLAGQVTTFQSQWASVQDYDEIKKELEIIKVGVMLCILNGTNASCRVFNSLELSPLQVGNLHPSSNSWPKRTKDWKAKLQTSK